MRFYYSGRIDSKAAKTYLIRLTIVLKVPILKSRFICTTTTASYFGQERNTGNTERAFFSSAFLMFETLRFPPFYECSPFLPGGFPFGHIPRTFPSLGQVPSPAVKARL